MKPRFLQVHWLRRAHSFAAAGTGLVAAGTERGHCGRGGRAGGSRAPAGRGRPAAVSPTPGPEWARPRLPGGGPRFSSPSAAPCLSRSSRPGPQPGCRAPPPQDAEWAGPRLCRAFWCGRQAPTSSALGAVPRALSAEPHPTSGQSGVLPSARDRAPPPSCPAARVQVRRLGGCPCRCGDAQGTRGPMWTHVQGEACASAGALGTRVCGGSHVCGHLWITDIGPRARPLRFVLESSPNVNLGARVSMRVWACGRACVGTSVCVHV